MKRMISIIVVGILTVLWAGSTHASEPVKNMQSTDLNYAQVTYVKMAESEDGSWCIHTTVRHNDEGWEHYASAWQVLDDSGNELAWRLLAHPHDTEQPFTRSKCDINIPAETKTIRVRAKCKEHGFGGEEVVVDLSNMEGEKYKISRIKP